MTHIRVCLRSFLILGAVISLLAGTTACNTSTTPGDGGNASVKQQRNLRPDPDVKWLYFSFDGDSVVPSDMADTEKWDVKFPFLTINSRTIDIMLNSGTVGPGTTGGVVVKSRWENVTTVTSSLLFAMDDTLAANRVIPNCVLCPEATFVYSGPPNHALTPSPDRVVIIKTSAGTVIKFQVTSIYQDAVADPVATTPIGYYHFRYVKAVRGSF